jgi:hypothetical protein
VVALTKLSAGLPTRRSLSSVASPRFDSPAPFPRRRSHTAIPPPTLLPWRIRSSSHQTSRISSARTWGLKTRGPMATVKVTPGSSLQCGRCHLVLLPRGMASGGRHDSLSNEEVRVTFYGTSSWTLGLGRPIVRPADVGTARRQVCIPHIVFHLLIDTHAVNVPHYQCMTRYKTLPPGSRTSRK